MRFGAGYMATIKLKKTDSSTALVFFHVLEILSFISSKSEQVKGESGKAAFASPERQPAPI